MLNNIKFDDIPTKGLDKLPISNPKIPFQLDFVKDYEKKLIDSSFELKDYFRLAWDSLNQYALNKAGYIEGTQRNIWLTILEFVIDILRGMFK